MKKWLQFFAVLLFCCYQSNAQNPRFYKDAANSYNNTSTFVQNAAHTQLMYTPADFAVLPPSGTITKIYFRTYYTEISAPATFYSFEVSLRQTPDLQFANNNFYTGLTPVVNNAVHIINSPQISKDGWVEIALTTPFAYNNTQTLVVDVKYIGAVGYINNWSDSITGYKELHTTSPTATSGTLSRLWNHFGMDVTATSGCTSPPTAGSVTWQKAVGCGVNSYLLDLAGNSGGTGQTYIWQSAPAQAGPFTNITVASAFTLAIVTPTANTWYRASVTCNANTSYTTPVLLTANTFLPAGTYTINSALPTSGTNFKSFTNMATALSCGITGPVTINVVPNSGLYYEQPTIPHIANTSSVNTIRINGNGANLRYKTLYTSTARAVMKLEGVDFLTIDSLVFNNMEDTFNNAANSYGVCVQILNDANNVTIQHCTIGSLDTALSSYNNGTILVASQIAVSPSVYYTDCDSIIVQNNRFLNGRVGIWGGLNPNQTKGCKVLNNTFFNSNQYYGNYYWYGGSYGTIGMMGQDGGVVEGNVIENSWHYAIWNDLNCKNSIISKNKVFDTSTFTSTIYYGYGRGIYLLGTNLTVTNNLVYLGDYNYPTTTFGMAFANINTALVSHNTVIISQTGSTLAYGVYFANTSNSGITFTNNLISVNAALNPNRAHIWRLATTTAGITADHNDYFGSANIGRISSAFHATLPLWQTASGHDLSSDTLDPQFISLATYNFRPARVALDNRGTPAGVVDDITNLGRSATTPDIGAYEFPGFICQPPTSLAVSGITSTTANFNWTAPAGFNNFRWVIDGFPSNPTVVGTSVAGSIYNATSGLLPMTTYYFHVRTDCGGFYSSWVTIPFTTGCASPSAVISPATVPPLCYATSTTLSAPIGTGFTYQWKRNGVNIPGATAATYTAGVAGSYTVQVTISTCSSTTTTPVIISILPQATITAAGSTTFCAGGSVNLNATTGTGYTYQWQQGGVNIPGATSATYTATTSGAYRAIINSGSCNDTSTVINVTAVAYPSNTISPLGPVGFCDRQSIRLTGALNPVFTYQWYKNGVAIAGAVSYFYDATTSGNYHVVISNGSCATTTNSVTVNVLPLPVATANAVGNTVFCNTGNVFMQGTPGTGLTYQWLRNGAVIVGATSANYTASQEGVYKVIVSNGTCLDTSVGLPVVFNAYPRPIITNVGGVLGTTIPFTTYQWNRNGLAIPFANSRYYTPTRDGSYVVTVSDTAGCLGSSNVITINTLAVGSANGNQDGVNIYPNPATDKVYITTRMPVLVSLTSTDGKLIIAEQRNTGMLDISSLAEGIYTLKLKDLNGNILKVEKLVKVK